MKMPLKFTAKSVDNLERKMGVSVENLLGSTTMQNLAQFIERAFYDEENDKVGVGNDKSYELLQEYLKENDKEDLLIDIMEGLQAGGFLSRKLNLEKIRTSLTKKTDEIDKKLTEDLAS